MDAIATVGELAERLPFDMDIEEEREALGTLEDLSEDARRIGRYSWDYATAPRQIKNLILRAAVRHMKNTDGFINSRAGDESVTWTDRGEQSGTAHFTTSEVAAIRVIAGHGGGLHSAPMSAWDSTYRTRHVYVPGTVPTGQGTRMPYFVDDTASPW